MEVSTLKNILIAILLPFQLYIFLLKQNILLCTIIRITINYITNVPSKNHFQTLMWRCWNDKTVHQFQLYMF